MDSSLFFLPRGLGLPGKGIKGGGVGGGWGGPTILPSMSLLGGSYQVLSGYKSQMDTPLTSDRVEGYDRRQEGRLSGGLSFDTFATLFSHPGGMGLVEDKSQEDKDKGLALDHIYVDIARGGGGSSKARCKTILWPHGPNRPPHPLRPARPGNGDMQGGHHSGETGSVPGLFLLEDRMPICLARSKV